MLRSRTVNNQILPVLKYARENIRRGLSVVEACRAAIHARQRELHVTYQTLEDGCRRRLDLEHIGEFHQLVAAWVEHRSGDLKTLLLQKSHASARSDIEEFFEEFFEPARDFANQSPPSRASEGFAKTPTGRSVITIDQLDPETTAVLGERARLNGRSLEAEITVTLTQAVRSDRDDFAKWAAGLRNRLRDRYVGDATVDIRSDRRR